MLLKIANHYPSSQMVIAASLEQMASDWYVEFARAGVEWQMLQVLYADTRERMAAEDRTAFAPSVDDILKQWKIELEDRERIARKSRQHADDQKFETEGYNAKPDPAGLEYFLSVGEEFLGWKRPVTQ